MQSLQKLFNPCRLIIYVLFLLNAQYLASASPLRSGGSSQLLKVENAETENTTPTATKRLTTRATFPDEAECSAKIRNPPKDKSLFFTRLNNQYDAINDFSDRGYLQVPEVYPEDFPWVGDAHDPDFRSYVDRASRVFAERSSGEINVIIGEEDPCTTWARVEFPALKQNSNVDKIIKVDAGNPKAKETIWTKGEPIKRQGLPPWDGGECLDWEGDRPPSMR